VGSNTQKPVCAGELQGGEVHPKLQIAGQIHGGVSKNPRGFLETPSERPEKTTGVYAQARAAQFSPPRVRNTPYETALPPGGESVSI
jgi:hypothetical protein